MKQEILWSTDAINCYKIDCDCTKCLLAKILETPCKMDLTVRKIIAAIGKPSEENTQKERKLHRFYRKGIEINGKKLRRRRKRKRK